MGQATTWAVHLYNCTPEAFDISIQTLPPVLPRVDIRVRFAVVE